MIRLAKSAVAPALVVSALLLGVSGCGGSSDVKAVEPASAEASVSSTADPSTDAASAGADGGRAAGASCVELEKVYDPKADNGPRTVDDHILTIAPTGVVYDVDLDDPVCRALPKVGRLVEEVRTQQTANRKSECRGTLKELRALDPADLADPSATIDNAKGSVSVDRLIDYAHSLCDEFGIEVPQG